MVKNQKQINSIRFLLKENFLTPEFSRQFDSLDVLVLNAGVFGLPFSVTIDGLETIFQVYISSTFALNGPSRYD